MATKDGSTTGFLIRDLHGNVAAADQSGSAAIAVAIRYDGYGQTLGSPYTGTGAIAMDAKYQGRLDLSATSDPLYDMAARFYAPGLGTFTQLDSVLGSAQNPLSMNRFLYAEANPATFIDPTGHFVSEGDSTQTSRCSHSGDWGCGKTAATSKSKVRAAALKPNKSKSQSHGNGRGATWGDKGGDEKHRGWTPPSLHAWLNFSDSQRNEYTTQHLGEAEEWDDFGQDDASVIVYWMLMRGDPGLTLPPTDVMFDMSTIDRLGAAIDTSPRTVDTAMTALSFRSGGDEAMWNMALSASGTQISGSAAMIRSSGISLPNGLKDRLSGGMQRYLSGGPTKSTSAVQTESVPDAAQAGGRIYSARVLDRMAEEPGPYHNFPTSVDESVFTSGSRTVTPGYYNQPRQGYSSTGIQYTHRGSINGTPGTYEIGTRLSLSGRNELVWHRFFRPD